MQRSERFDDWMKRTADVLSAGEKPRVTVRMAIPLHRLFSDEYQEVGTVDWNQNQIHIHRSNVCRYCDQPLASCDPQCPLEILRDLCGSIRIEGRLLAISTPRGASSELWRAWSRPVDPV